MSFVFEEYQNILFVLLITFAASAVTSRLVLFSAMRFGLLAKENSRSSHQGKLAFGGGISVVGVSLVAWGWMYPPVTQIQLLILVCSIVLGIISWVDDLRDVSFVFRFVAQVFLVGMCLWALPGDQNILPFDWPLWLDRLLAGFFWIWFINLFNFMDGIDGLASVETATIGIGIVLVGMIGFLKNEWLFLALALAGAVSGFLPYNWHKARIILGDLGAVTIGFILGFLLIQLAIGGYWVASLILPGYFVADSTITILRRLARKEKIWLAHRTHFYQRACTSISGHDGVVVRVVVANLALVGLAVFSVSQPLLAGVLSIGVVSVLLISLTRMAKA